MILLEKKFTHDCLEVTFPIAYVRTQRSLVSYLKQQRNAANTQRIWN